MAYFVLRPKGDKLLVRGPFNDKTETDLEGNKIMGPCQTVHLPDIYSLNMAVKNIRNSGGPAVGDDEDWTQGPGYLTRKDFLFTPEEKEKLFKEQGWRIG